MKVAFEIIPRGSAAIKRRPRIVPAKTEDSDRYSEDEEFALTASPDL